MCGSGFSSIDGHNCSFPRPWFANGLTPTPVFRAVSSSSVSNCLVSWWRNRSATKFLQHTHGLDFGLVSWFHVAQFVRSNVWKVQSNGRRWIYGPEKKFICHAFKGLESYWLVTNFKCWVLSPHMYGQITLPNWSRLRYYMQSYSFLFNCLFKLSCIHFLLDTIYYEYLACPRLMNTHILAWEGPTHTDSQPRLLDSD